MGGTFFLVDISVAEGGGERGRRRGFEPLSRGLCRDSVRVAAPSGHFAAAHALLAAAPTTPPCFRHWRRSSLLPGRGAFGKEAGLSAMPRAPLLAGAVAARRLGGVSPFEKLFSQISKKGLQKGAGGVIIHLAVNCALRNCVLKDVPL